MNVTRRTFGAAAAAMALAPKARAEGAKSKILDVIVLGAGMSGLNTAWLLEQQGLTVLVLEGRKRVGGRVMTLMDQPGTPELGFNAMGAGYGRGLDAARRARVELYDAAPRFKKSYQQELVLGRKIVTRDQWAGSPANPFPAARKGMMPWEIAGRLISEGNPLKDWSQWADAKSASLDISMHDFLKAQGLNNAAIRLAFDTSPYYGTSALDVSALMFEFNDGWTKAQAVSGFQSWAVKGGNAKLPQGMAKLLKGDLLFDKAVIGISSASDAATVVCRDGASYRAKAVVCSLPFSTLREVKIDPPLDGRQAKAVGTLPYQPISMAFLTVREPFWEKDGLSPSMWTDGPLGNLVAQRFGATENDVTGLMAVARGEMAHVWDRAGAAEMGRRIIDELEAIRPASKGLVSVAAWHSWAMEPFNGGDWAYFSPGQIADFAAVMSAPAGRLHFCGEHTAMANRGLEGALESSERVAVDVLTA